MSKRTALILTTVTYFLAQSVVVTFKKWKSMNLLDRVHSLETLVVTLTAFCISCDILLDNRFEGFIHSNIRGELFGFRGGLINKYAHHAYIRGGSYVRKLRKEGKFGGVEDEKITEEMEELKMTHNRGKKDGIEGEEEEEEEESREKGELKINKHQRESGEESESKRNNNGRKNEREQWGKFKKEKEGESKISNNNSHKINNGNNLKFSIGIGCGERYFNFKRTSNHVLDEWYENSSSTIFKTRNIEENSRAMYFSTSSRPSECHLKMSAKSSQFETAADAQEIFQDDFTEITDENSDRNSSYLTLEIDGKRRRPSMKTRKIIEKQSEKCAKLIKFAITLQALLCSSMNIVQLCKILFHFVGGTKITDFETSFLTYFPFTESSSPETVQQFTVVVILEYCYLFLFYQLGMDITAIILLVYFMTHTEIGLLMKSLKEFDEYLKGRRKFLDKIEDELQERVICEKFKHIAAHHQAILSKVRKLSEMVSFRVLYINGALCFELCIAIFLIVEGDHSLKIKYVVIAICLVIICALVSEDGQLVDNGLADLRDSFYDLSWLNLPIKLRKSLLIVLTRSTRPTQIGSMGVFYINRVNFKTIIQASYSYFNLLTRFKKQPKQIFKNNFNSSRLFFMWLFDKAKH